MNYRYEKKFRSCPTGFVIDKKHSQEGFDLNIHRRDKLQNTIELR